MPPKPKFTREEIIQAALTIVSQKGADALTAREVGEQLGSSARPIFTVFKNMEELQAEVRQAAMERFEARVAQTEPGDPPVQAGGHPDGHLRRPGTQALPAPLRAGARRGGYL